MIFVEGLTRRYGSKVAVDDVSFHVRSGSVTGFLGSNGSGKSTTMRMMAGLTRPCSGSSRILGTEYRNLENPGRQVGLLLDASAQHSGRTGREVFRLGAQMMGVPRSRIEETLALVGLDGAPAKQRVGHYSLGMRQRLGIGHALLGDPSVLVLDEPANGLDPEGIRWMRTLLRDFANRGGAVLLSSHQLHEVQMVADDLVIIGHGRVLANGPVDTLLHETGVSVRTSDETALLGAFDTAGIASTRSADGWIHTNFDAGRVIQVAAQASVPIVELRPAKKVILEDLYLELTSQPPHSDADLANDRQRRNPND